MTIREAVENYQYYVSIYYYVDDIDGKEGWCWEVNGGYCQQWSNEKYPSAMEAQNSLITFLETFKGFCK